MTQAPLSTRLPAIILTIIPLLCLIPSFVLAAYSSSHKDWTWRTEYDQQSHGFLGITHRGPFQTCVLTTKPNSPDVCTHTLKPGGLCDENSRARGDNMHFCRQLTLGGRLLYSGDALLGAALLGVLVLTASTAMQVLRSANGTYVPSLFGLGYTAPASTSVHHRNRHHALATPTALRSANHTPLAYVTLLTRLLSALSSLLLLTGTFITTNTLVNIQYPIGDWYTTGNPDNFDIVTQDFAGPWLMGKAVGWCAAGAVLAGVASYLIGLVWEVPQVGVDSTFAGLGAAVEGESKDTSKEV